MTMHSFFLKCCGIFKKILENSITPAIDIKAGRVPGGRVGLASWPLVRDTFRLAVGLSIRIRSGVFWLRLRSVRATRHGFREAGIDVTRAKIGSPRVSEGPSLQALILLGGARFITFGSETSFLGECRRAPRHFGSRWSCLGYGPAIRPT